MGIDNDLSALLPDPPPPRPARREAAITEALRRFDAPAGEVAPPPPAAGPRPSRPLWARPQLAAFASVALVVMFSVPLWWSERDRSATGVPPEPAPAVAQQAPSAAPAPGPAAEVRPAGAAREPSEAVAAAEPTAAASAVLQDLASADESAPPPPAPPPPPPAPVPPAQLQRLPQAPAQAQAARRSAPAPQVAGEAEVDDSGRAIVVTGSRVERGDFETRSPIAAVADAAPLDGEWNACTLDDPRRNPTVCRGSAARNAAQIDDGLALAWQGELDRAIAAFDRAIATSPDLALAYLNRGLAYRAKGDLRRARADFDRAVARDRTNAQAYYHRSRLFRAQGDTTRADADARRAIELDPSYAAALP